MDSRGLQTCFLKGTKGLVIKTFDNKLLFSAQNKVYELDAVPIREEKSKEFDFVPSEKPRKRKIPSAKHPWRSNTFWNFRNRGLNNEMLAC